MIRRALPLLALLAIAACSSGEPADGLSLDALSRNLLRAPSAVPAFGGVAFEGDRLVVFTLGEQPGAVQAVRSLFGTDTDVDVRARPEHGQGSESLKDAVSGLGIEGTISVDYDETTGYVRLGVVNADAVRRASTTLAATDLPVAEIIAQVNHPIGYF